MITSCTWLSRSPAAVIFRKPARFCSSAMLRGPTRPRPDPPRDGEEAPGQRSPVGAPPLDPLRDELALRLDVGLEIPVLAPLLHRLQRSHPAVHLVGPALVQDHLAGTLLGPRAEGADP